MFCARCGTQMELGYSVCPKCGREVGDLVRAVAYTRLDRHLHTLGILWIVIGGLFVIPAVGLAIFGGSAHFMLHQEEPIAGLLPVLLYVAAGTLGLLAAGGVLVGLGLMQKRPWARAAAIVLGVLALFHPPFGTALGVYTLWVLPSDESGVEYQYLARAS